MDRYAQNFSGAVRFSEDVILRSTDWQEVQDALANHSVYGPWIEEIAADDALALSQTIIREAESNLGDRLPAGYA